MNMNSPVSLNELFDRSWINKLFLLNVGNEEKTFINYSGLITILKNHKKLVKNYLNDMLEIERYDLFYKASGGFDNIIFRRQTEEINNLIQLQNLYHDLTGIYLNMSPKIRDLKYCPICYHINKLRRQIVDTVMILFIIGHVKYLETPDNRNNNLYELDPFDWLSTEEIKELGDEYKKKIIDWSKSEQIIYYWKNKLINMFSRFKIFWMYYVPDNDSFVHFRNMIMIYLMLYIGFDVYKTIQTQGIDPNIEMMQDIYFNIFKYFMKHGICKPNKRHCKNRIVQIKNLTVEWHLKAFRKLEKFPNNNKFYDISWIKEDCPLNHQIEDFDCEQRSVIITFYWLYLFMMCCCYMDTFPLKPLIQ